MPFEPALSTFTLKGSYPHLVARVPRQVAKAERRSPAALRCLPAPFPRAVPAASGAADPAGTPRIPGRRGRDGPSALCGSHRSTRAGPGCWGSQPVPGDGFMPGAGGILLPPAVTVSHTHERHTLCPGSPQLQGMRIA